LCYYLKHEHMRTKIIFSALYILFFTGQTVFSQCKIPTDLQNEGLLGKVKSMTTKSYQSNEPNKTPTVSETFLYDSGKKTFNKSGYYLENIRYDKSGVVSKHEKYDYDANGHLVKIIGIDKQGVEHIIKTFQIDNTGKRIGRNDYYWNGKISDSTSLKWDSKGNLIWIIDANPEKKTVEKIEKRWYDDKDNIIERSYEMQYDGFLEKYSTRKYKYNQDGNMIEQVEYNRDSIAKYWYTWVYSNKYDFVENYYYSEDGKKPAKPVSTTRYDYDDKGNILEESGQDGVKKSIYVYDSYGNWTKKTFLENNKTTYIEVRSFEYY